MVSVPVLSNMTVSTSPAPSSAAPPRMRMPDSAARPVPTMIAVGVARPMAQGQAMMSTEIAATMACVKAGAGPSMNQTANVPAASSRTRGTNRALMRSAIRAMGALEPCAVSTMRTIWASTVSLPTRVARITKLPLPFMVAPMTGSPGKRATGIDSPVIIDSLTLEAPSTSTPSTGMVSPARTRSRSAGRT